MLTCLIGFTLLASSGRGEPIDLKQKLDYPNPEDPTNPHLAAVQAAFAEVVPRFRLYSILLETKARDPKVVRQAELDYLAKVKQYDVPRQRYSLYAFANAQILGNVHRLVQEKGKWRAIGIPGAQVTIIGRDRKELFTVFTNADGGFNFAKGPTVPSRYILQVDAPGFRAHVANVDFLGRQFLRCPLQSAPPPRPPRVAFTGQGNREMSEAGDVASYQGQEGSTVDLGTGTLDSPF